MSRTELLAKAAELKIPGRHRMTVRTLALKVKVAERSLPKCSACRSTAPHHVKHVLLTGQCIV